MTPYWPRLDSVWFRRLKLYNDELLSNVAFKYNLRRCMLEPLTALIPDGLNLFGSIFGRVHQGLTLIHFSAQLKRV